MASPPFWNMKGTKNWYVMQMTNVPTRFGLSKNARKLLQLLDEFKGGCADEAELGRQVRLSAENRKAIPETIRKCATLMVKKPEETKTCLLLIDMCTEILEIANREPDLPGFPFLKLPREIRGRILNMIVDEQHGGPEKFIQVEWANKCSCVNPERLAFGSVPEQQQALFDTLGQAMHHEFWSVLFRRRTWYFPCCCCLDEHLLVDGTLRRYLRNAHIHWCGPLSDKAFKQLAVKCPSLRNLTIKISKSTTTHFNKRDKELAAYFPLAYKKPRVMDCLGSAELLLIRKIENVEVEHVSSAQRVQLSEFDRQGLQSLLEATLKKRF